MDFGPTASDYGKYRTPFPPELFTRLAALDVGLPGHRIVDLGTGTGTLARDLTAAGCTVTGIDIAPELLTEARRQDAAEGLEVIYRLAPAEDTRLPAGAWDAVTAGHCWHWFDRPRAAAEAHRLLATGGTIVICYRDAVIMPGNVCAASEELARAYNPNWPAAGGLDDHPEWADDLTQAGFGGLQTFSFGITVAFTHEAWRGRMRSSSGIGASLPKPRVTAFDTDLTRLLQDQFPHEPLQVPHRISALIGWRNR